MVGVIEHRGVGQSQELLLLVNGEAVLGRQVGAEYLPLVCMLLMEGPGELPPFTVTALVGGTALEILLVFFQVSLDSFGQAAESPRILEVQNAFTALLDVVALDIRVTRADEPLPAWHTPLLDFLGVRRPNT